jgi:hypothetical protein
MSGHPADAPGTLDTQLRTILDSVDRQLIKVMADASDLVEAVLEAAGPSITETLDRTHGVDADHALDSLLEDEIDSDDEIIAPAPGLYLLVS